MIKVKCKYPVLTIALSSTLSVSTPKHADIVLSTERLVLDSFGHRGDQTPNGPARLFVMGHDFSQGREI